MPRSIQTIFQEFVEKKVPIFKDRNALTSHFTPETIPHRDKQINDLATILAPSLKGGRPSNIFVYGLTGTGKCVIGPTLVYLANPGPVSIQSIVDNNRSKLIEKSLDYSIYSPSRSLIVYSIGNKLNIVKDKIIYLYKEKAPEKLVKIKTTSGREIITSLKHPFQILKNGILGFKNSIHLKKNDFIAIPRIIPVERRSTHLSFTKNFYEVNSGFVLVKDGCNPIKKINKSDEDLAEFLGIMIGEGTCRYYGHYYIAITNKNPLIIEKIRKIFDRFKLGYRIQESKKQPGLKEIIVSSKTFYYYLKEVLGYPVNKLSHQKEVPKIIFSSSINIRSAFLRGLFETDGYISKRDPVIEYSTSSPTLSNQVLYLLLNFGIVGRLKVKEKERKHFRIIVSGKQFLKKFKKKIGFMSKEKTRRLKQHLKKKDNTNVDVIPNIGSELKKVRVGLRIYSKSMDRNKYNFYFYENNLRFPSRLKLRRYVVKFKRRMNKIRFLYLMCKIGNDDYLPELTKKLKLQLKDIAPKIGVSQSMLSYYRRRNKKKFKTFLIKIKNLILQEAESILNNQLLKEKIDFLEMLADSDVFWDRIKEVTILENHGYDYIYDIETENTHTFVGGAGGIISHNTLVSKYVGQELEKTSNKGASPVKVIYINCKMKKVADTEYRLIAELSRVLGQDVPITGLPTKQVYDIFYSVLDSKEQTVIVILDEIDALVEKMGDGFLYNFTRIDQELKKAKVSIIGITNDLHFIDILDPRVKSSLSEEEILFPPYNALELQDILKQRVELGFQPKVLSEEVIPKCAALAAQEHGDARRALDLLRVAGEIAERQNDTKITEKHVDMALEKIDYDRVIESVKSLPKQTKVVLWSIISLDEKKQEDIQTGDVYGIYEDKCKECALHPLTQRRISDLISELDMMGVINAKITSFGRYGRTRLIKLNVSTRVRDKIKDILKSSLLI